MKKQNQKGITLIALIITIIVMLILVGVTISVALNGGLFGKGEKAAFQTGASTVKEQLEIEKAARIMDADGKLLKDYSVIKVGDLEGLDKATKEKFENKIVVNKNGDICYDPVNVTDQEEKKWLEEIGIKAYVNNTGDGNNQPGENDPGGNEPTETAYSFTLNELGEWEIGDGGGWIVFNASNVWDKIGRDLSEESNYFDMIEGMTVGNLETDNTIFSSLTLEILGQSQINENTQILIAPLWAEDEGNGYFIITTGQPEKPSTGYLRK